MEREREFFGEKERESFGERERESFGERGREGYELHKWSSTGIKRTLIRYIHACKRQRLQIIAMLTVNNNSCISRGHQNILSLTSLFLPLSLPSPSLFSSSLSSFSSSFSLFNSWFKMLIQEKMMNHSFIVIGNRKKNITI